MSTQKKDEQDIIRLSNQKDYPLLYIQIQNNLHTKECKAVIEDHFEMLLCQTVVEILLNKG